MDVLCTTSLARPGSGGLACVPYSVKPMVRAGAMVFCSSTTICLDLYDDREGRRHQQRSREQHSFG